MIICDLVMSFNNDFIVLTLHHIFQVLVDKIEYLSSTAPLTIDEGCIIVVGMWLILNRGKSVSINYFQHLKA